MNVELVRYPEDRDWMDCKDCALETVGLRAKNAPDSEWRRKILRARHSPIRELLYKYRITDLPYYIAMHLVRHHAGCQPYVRTQRNDRQSNYDRRKAPQDALVTMRWTLNAESLMNLANKRLCEHATEETREVVQEMCRLAIEATPELYGLLVPMCIRNGGRCDEMKPCDKYNWGETK